MCHTQNLLILLHMRNDIPLNSNIKKYVLDLEKNK